MSKMIAPCGIDCSICDAYFATITDDSVLKQKLADNYEAQMGKKISLSEMECFGCPSAGKHISFCEVCEIRTCANAKGFATCAECQDFPCEKGSFIWKSNSESRKNLEEIRGGAQA